MRFLSIVEGRCCIGILLAQPFDFDLAVTVSLWIPLNLNSVIVLSYFVLDCEIFLLILFFEN